ncbi:hypothetical protein HYV12_01680 [Candidatus Dojkabacteria bacterium]|nr:hypothetical protein [Candidatus Dojkabacteria bacterium]
MEKGYKIIQVVGTIIGIILIPYLIGLGMNFQKSRAEKYPWSGSFFNRTYSEANQLTDSKRNKFKTVNECQTWAKEKAEWYDLKEGEWDYECGKNCEYKDQGITGGKRIETFECEEITQ